MYINTWCNFNKKAISNISDLQKEGINGYLKLKLQEISTYKCLHIFSIDDNDYYIISGVFIMPQTKSLIYDNPGIEIKGYMLDTTWRV